MASQHPPQRTPQQQALLPAGSRWGTGVESLTPYLRHAWSARTRNPVFTPTHFAALVWPANAGPQQPRGKSSKQ
ncbi:hypothetical protein [Ramlibacter sp.]|uniref:hypothetical protein n=1 Tax=Ramlibacter sp. TaxID=1917967 RepID=UPI0017F75DEB|nr:hypothetical protein [Ramlibacter sp.]MBA2675843.1 hypothetical protein [Ramlibacter sp.]